MAVDKAEAQALKSFKHYCNCGGYARYHNGRNAHMYWCAQFKEFITWWDALNGR